MIQDQQQTPRPETHARKKRKDAGQPRWEERDYYCLQWIGEQGFIRFDQLQRLLGRESSKLDDWDAVLSPSATRNAIGRWESEKLINCTHLIPREPQYYWLSSQGLQFLSLDLPHFNPASLRHGRDQITYLFACNQVRLYIELMSRMNKETSGDPEHYQWQSHRQLRHAIPDPRVRLPSSLFRTEKQDLIAIEVELVCKKQAKRQMQSFAQSIASGAYAEVQYFALSDPFHYLQDIHDSLKRSGLNTEKISITQADSIIFPSHLPKKKQ
jgi:hypothetical protein